MMSVLACRPATPIPVKSCASFINTKAESKCPPSGIAD